MISVILLSNNNDNNYNNNNNKDDNNIISNTFSCESGCCAQLSRGLFGAMTRAFAARNLNCLLFALRAREWNRLDLDLRLQ